MVNGCDLCRAFSAWPLECAVSREESRSPGKLEETEGITTEKWNLIITFLKMSIFWKPSKIVLGQENFRDLLKASNTSTPSISPTHTKVKPKGATYYLNKQILITNTFN